MRIAILSDSPTIPTGYQNQASQLVKYLENKGHEVFWMANAYVGRTMNGIKLEEGLTLKAKIYGSMFGQDYFANTMSIILKENRIDRFIILLDTFMLHGHPENKYAGWFLNVDTSPAKTYFWFPTDGGGQMPDGCELILQKVDKAVAMSKFGQKQVKDYYGINTGYIPHGLNIKNFYKLDDQKRAELRIKWGLTDKFVIGVVARNQPRKNLDRSIKIMAKLRDKIPNAVLLMHLDPNDPAQQMFNLPKLIQRYNLENRVIFTGMKAFKGFDTNQMNDVYNLMDVFLLTTSGEGFGIPIIEAMSAEIPVLATSYTTTPELVEMNQAGLGIKLSGVEEINCKDFFDMHSSVYDLKVADGTMTGTWNVERGLCSIDDAVNKLVQLCADVNARKMMGLKGRNAVLRGYDFEKVGKAWEEILQI